MAKDIYVVVADKDGGGGGPIVFETDIENSSKEDAIVRIYRLDGMYGECRIAKLNFIEMKEEN